MGFNMSKLLLLILFCFTLVSCSSYKIKLGKNCIDNKQGGQSWSYIWFIKNTDFNRCNYD